MTASATARDAVTPRGHLVGVFGGLFLGYFGLMAAIPVLPVFARQHLGAANFAVGLVVTVTGGTALLARPLAGALADRRGHRQVMQAGALAVAAGGLLYLLPLGLGWLIAVRLMLGVGEAALFTAGAAWTVALAPQHRRGQMIGLYGVSMWGGISAGTLAGAALLRFGFAAVWALCAAAPLAAALLLGVVPAAAKAGGGTARGLLLRPALAPGIALALAAAGYAGLAAFVVLHLRARGIHSGVAVLSCFSAVYAATRLFIGHLPDKLGPRVVAAWSGAGEAAGLVMIAVAPNLPVAVCASVVMGAGFSLLHPSLALMVMNRADQAKQGAALGAYTSFWDLGLAVWGPVCGLIAGGFGYPAVFLAGAACAILAGAMALRIGVRAQPIRSQPATAS